jgi:glycosyltransferase involved in cell wall biosynthesis
MKNSPEEKIQISVVTPVYNGESFVQSAYYCLCRQTYQNWEWVVVNDGSTDNTVLHLKKLAEKDNRIRIFQQKNSGAAKQPRDHAVYESKGDFVLPLDIDDQLSDDYLELMLKRQEETNADIIYPIMIFRDLDSGKITKTLPVEGFDDTKVYRSKELVRETAPEWNIGCNGGLYKRKVWINMSWPEKKEPIWMYSDEVDERLYMIHANTAAFASARYYYQNHEHSITGQISPKIFHTLKTNIQLLDITAQEYGNNSEEYHRMMRRVFYDWRWKTALFVAHHEELAHAAAEIQVNLAKCFCRIDVGVLTFGERIQFMNMVSFPLVLAMMCLKYKPTLLVEKMTQRLCPQKYANKYIRRRTETEIREAISPCYQERNAKKDYQTTVINIFCGNAPCGGLIDRLRGAVSTYQTCQETGRTFKLHFTHPFVLSDYLEPNGYNWEISSDEVTFEPSQTERLIVCSVLDTMKERQKHQQQTRQVLSNSKERQVHVYSNAAYCYDNDFGRLFRTLFKPSKRLQKSINNSKAVIGEKYVTVSARFCNCLDDFNEEMYSEPLDVSERKQLLDCCMAELTKITKKHPEERLVICSDSITFIDEAKKHFDIITTPGTISHIGNDDVHNYEYYEKTFLDFYTIVYASEVFLLKGPHMMKSGFPYAAALVGQKPFNVIEF